jgi:hypothetical protein
MEWRTAVYRSVIFSNMFGDLQRQSLRAKCRHKQQLRCSDAFHRIFSYRAGAAALMHFGQQKRESRDHGHAHNEKCRGCNGKHVVTCAADVEEWSWTVRRVFCNPRYITRY